MKIAITLVLLYLVSCGITATAPVAPVPLPGAIVNGIQAATLTEVCITESCNSDCQVTSARQYSQASRLFEDVNSNDLRQHLYFRLHWD